MSTTFGPLLRRWRSDRRYTQERLALEAEVSTRHLSFLEGGKASPSREMVLLLASVLELPLRDRNVLLGAAGYTPVYGAGSLDDEGLAAVSRALELILAKHEPFGAVVLDRLGNVQRMNDGARRLFGFVLGEAAAALPPEVLGNVHHALFHPRALRPYVVDWEALAGLLMERLHREIALHPEDTPRRQLRDALLAYPGVPARFAASRSALPTDPIIPVHMSKDGRELRILSTLTMLGTPMDVTAQELTIESYYPLDAATQAFMEGLAAAS